MPLAGEEPITNYFPRIGTSRSRPGKLKENTRPTVPAKRKRDHAPHESSVKRVRVKNATIPRKVSKHNGGTVHEQNPSPVSPKSRIARVTRATIGEPLDSDACASSLEQRDTTTRQLPNEKDISASQAADVANHSSKFDANQCRLPQSTPTETRSRSRVFSGLSLQTPPPTNIPEEKRPSVDTHAFTPPVNMPLRNTSSFLPTPNTPFRNVPSRTRPSLKTPSKVNGVSIVEESPQEYKDMSAISPWGTSRGPFNDEELSINRDQDPFGSASQASVPSSQSQYVEFTRPGPSAKQWVSSPTEELSTPSGSHSPSTSVVEGFDVTEGHHFVPSSQSQYLEYPYPRHRARSGSEQTSVEDDSETTTNAIADEYIQSSQSQIERYLSVSQLSPVRRRTSEALTAVDGPTKSTMQPIDIVTPKRPIATYKEQSHYTPTRFSQRTTSEELFSFPTQDLDPLELDQEEPADTECSQGSDLDIPALNSRCTDDSATESESEDDDGLISTVAAPKWVPRIETQISQRMAESCAASTELIIPSESISIDTSANTQETDRSATPFSAMGSYVGTLPSDVKDFRDMFGAGESDNPESASQ